MVGHLEAAGDERRHLVVLQPEHGAHRADVLALVWNNIVS